MTEAELPLVPYARDAHEPALIRFLGEAFDAGKVESRRRVLDWIHEGMPERDRAPLRYVIADGDRLAASMGHLPADFLVRGRTVAARFTHDLLVDPRYRGQGLAKRIVEHALRLGDFLPGGMWMTEPCYKIHLASGFADMKPLVTQTLVLDPRAFAARKGFSGAHAWTARAALAVVRARSLRAAAAENRAAGASVRALDAFDPGMDGSWRKLLGGYGVARIRNAAYLNWKYCRHPNLAYRALVAEGDRGVAGYLVWRPPTASDPDRRALVTDFLVANCDASTLRRLLARAVADANESQAAVLSMLTTQPWAMRLLRSSGFFPRDERHRWVVGGWRDVIPEAWRRDHSAWHLCMGDSDGDLWA